MADNKNQHFVPQFYLRNFSADTKRRCVNLFNIGRLKAVPMASIKGQCSRNYWHGIYDPILEKSLRNLEMKSAKDIKACINSNKLQGTRSLKTFVMLQLGRTVYSAEAFVEMKGKAHKLIYGKPAENSAPNPVRNIAMYLMNSPIILDMSACLVVNRTKLDFLTSDNPVTLSNWWFRHIYRKRPAAGVGLAQAGLEICFPLSPRHQLILYDSNIWSVQKSDAAGTLYLDKEHDVLALNERQVLNAHHNVYFASMESVDQVLALADECADRRSTDKVQVYEFVQATGGTERFVPPSSPDANTEVRDKLLMTEPEAIDPQRRITFLSKRLKPRFCDHPSAVGALRDLAWMRIVKDFRTCLKSRERELTDLDQFAAEHPLFHQVGKWKKHYWI